MKTFFLSLLLICNFFISAQNKTYFKDLEITYLAHPILFKSDNVVDENYPLNNIFDGNFKSCWIISNQSKESNAFIKLPDIKTPFINIFNGYGKSKALYYENARPKQLHISFYYGILPEAYSSENNFLYKIADLHIAFDINLRDEFGVQSFSIPENIQNKLQELIVKAKTIYKQTEFPKAEEEGIFINISLNKQYEGTKYKDVCISEIFFNPPYIAKPDNSKTKINKIYLDDELNTLFVDTDKQKHKIVYQNKNEILDIVEVSQNKEWAILFAMPAENDGRSEVKYLLFDIVTSQLIDSVLEKTCMGFHSGYDIYFEQIEKKLFLKYLVEDGLYNFVELKHQQL